MTITVSGFVCGEGVEQKLDALAAGAFASRLFAKDATLWGPDAAPEAAIRLGWTDVTATATALIPKVDEVRNELAAHGVSRVVLCGMGGSSLAPLVMAPNLTVLDSTHPDAVRVVLGADLSDAVVVVSSKSGGTVETLSHLAAADEAFTAAGIDPAERIVVVTDPQSALHVSATSAGYRVFLADPNVGGRFSALTAFGIVPSVLAGADMSEIVRDAAAARERCAVDSADNPALQLAAIIAAGLPERFVLELRPDSSLPEAFGLWVEQLVAESTGKDRQGILPIALPYGSTTSGTAQALDIELFAAVAAIDEGSLGTTPDPATNGSNASGGVGVRVAGTLGEQLLLWQVVTAALGYLMGVDPFNQPDVEAAKVAARASFGSPVELPVCPSASELSAELRSVVPAGGYLSIQAYVNNFDEAAAAGLEALRARLSEVLEVPVACGFGPRYLHSTGQLHKGGPAAAAFLQLVELSDEDVVIPGDSLTFAGLMSAQAAGDAGVLRERGRAVVGGAVRDLPEYLRLLVAALK